jgi:hypothetical protein
MASTDLGELKMNPTSWRNIAEILGVGAIVFSLILVAYELRQNTLATELGVATSFESSFGEMELFIAGNPEFAALLLKGIDGEELSSIEQLRLTIFYRRVLRSWQNLHYQYLSGALDESLWLGQQAGNEQTILSDNGLRTAWKANKLRFTDEFNSMIEGILVENNIE